MRKIVNIRLNLLKLFTEDCIGPFLCGHGVYFIYASGRPVSILLLWQRSGWIILYFTAICCVYFGK